jgi:hypothetical protein
MPLGFLKSLDADDIFISYSREDGSAYLTGLDAALSEKGFSCFTDRRGTDADPLPPATLFRKIRSCKTLVLLATPGAIKRPENIAAEVAEFAKTNGTARIVCVSFDRGMELADWPNTPWYIHVEGKAREREDPNSLITGEPTPAVVAAIVTASDYMKSKDRLGKYRDRALAGFLCLLAAGILAGSLAVYGFWQAQRQSVIAESRSLANRSATLLRRQPDALQRAIGLAIQAVSKSSSIGLRLVEGDGALRESLSLLPRYLGGTSYRGEIVATALSPDGLYFAALTSDKTLRVYRVGDMAPLAELRGGEGSDIALSSNACHAAVASRDSVTVYDLKTRLSRVIRLLKPGPKDENVEIVAEQVALSPGGEYLALIKSVQDTGSQRGMADIEAGVNDADVWDIATQRQIVRLSRGDRNHYISFAANGDLALGAGVRLRGEFSGFSGRTSIWRLSRKLHGNGLKHRLAGGDFVGVERYPQGVEVHAVASAPDGSAYATA